MKKIKKEERLFCKLKEGFCVHEKYDGECTLPSYFNCSNQIKENERKDNKK